MMANQMVDGAVLVLRLWRDANSPQGFRARILRTDDLTSEHEQTVMATTAKDVMVAVEDWLTVFMRN